MGINGENMVYLDLTHMDPEYLTRKLGGIMEIYEKFVGDDPRKVPMKIFPAVHYTMGGMWTQYTPGSYVPQTPHGVHKPGMVPPIDTEPGRGMAVGAPNNMMTNINGLYAFGEVNFAYHGATRLGANALLSCIFDGLFCGPSVVNYLNEQQPVERVDQSVFDAGVKAEQDKVQRLLDSVSNAVESPEDHDKYNAYVIGNELGDEMTAASTVVKTEARKKRSPRSPSCASGTARSASATGPRGPTNR
jgi:succinate dehydrogenase / fumarate reductase flavoprotein subunit